MDYSSETESDDDYQVYDIDTIAIDECLNEINILRDYHMFLKGINGGDIYQFIDDTNKFNKTTPEYFTKLYSTLINNTFSSVYECIKKSQRNSVNTMELLHRWKYFCFRNTRDLDYM